MSKHFNLAVDADGIALITMDSPGRSMNVFAPGRRSGIRRGRRARRADAAIKGADRHVRKIELSRRLRPDGTRAQFDRSETAARPTTARRGLHGAVPAHGNERQALGGRDQWSRARRWLRALSRLPLPRHGGRSESLRRLARSQGGPAARGRRHAAHAAPGRHRATRCRSCSKAPIFPRRKPKSSASCTKSCRRGN